MTRPTAGDPLRGDGPLVITLCATSVPMMLQLPLLSVFAGLTVFRSHAVEDGRERFRMHLGYFYDRARAEKVLGAARRFYPGAFLAEAPESDLGSLDDTLNTAFQFATGPAARLVAAERLPTADEFESALAAAARREPAYDDSAGADDAVGEGALADDMRTEHEFWARAGGDGAAAGEVEADAAVDRDDPAERAHVAEVDGAGAEVDARAALEILAAGPSAAAAPAMPANPASTRGMPRVAATPHPAIASVMLDPGTTVLDVLDAPTPAHAADAQDAPRAAHASDTPQAPDAGARARDRRTLAVQRYAVQLRWSLSPVDPQAIPHHALFRQFTLYGVTVQRGDASEHGLRLGFFSNLYSAKQVADYVRHDFPCASVVPVSEREMVRAQQAAWNELLARVGVQARGASRASSDDGASAAVRRDRGLRRLWGRQG